MAGLISPAISRQQLSTVAWLRWRLLMSAFRRKGVAGEIIARIFLFPVLACFAIGPAVGAGFAGYYAVSQNLLTWLSVPLWLLFFLWQFVGISTSAAGPAFDLTTLTRFPIRFRDYLIVRLSCGLLDPQTLVGGLALIGMTAGIGIADAALLPWAAFVLFLYGVCNVLFSRMLYSWLEKWLAQRRTREFVGALILVASLSIQMINPLIRRFGGEEHRSAAGPAVTRFAHASLLAGNFLPPGLAGSAIASMQHGQAAAACGFALAVFGFSGVFLYILRLRLHAQYLGENLSEAPAAPRPSLARRQFPARAEAGGTRRGILPAVISASLMKEVRHLMRSGPILYSLVTPIFMIAVFGSQAYGKMNIAGVGSPVFLYGCAYLQLFLVAFLYNSFGNDGTGVQLYFFTPIRIRDIVLAKNLLIFGIVVAEITLMYLAISLISVHPSFGLTALALCWVIFTFLVSMTFGNLRSVYSPRKMPESGMRSMRLSGLNSLISFGVLAVPFLLGAGTLLLCHRYDGSPAIYLIVTSGFAALIALAAIGYVSVLKQLDAIAADHRLEIAAELCKS